ncbi:MAG TPA: acyltransferase [Ramlibacter sp.]|nr:acyltransferase [Ramlibacter sp.]
MTPPQRIAATHFEALDGWRGICACCVVLFHFHGYSPIYTSPLVRNSYLFVDFFFVLSGFVIAWNYAARLDSWHGVKRFLILRWGRVYPLHIFMLFCFLAYETVRLLNGLGRPSPPPTFTGGNQPLAVLTNLFLVQSLNLHDSLTWNGPAWSISTEFWTYVIFALISVWLGMRNWVLVAAAVTAPILLYQVSRTGMDITFDYGLIRCLFGFALGVACYRIYRRRPPQAPVAGVGAMTILECAVVAAVVLFVSAAGTSAWSLLAPFVFALAVLVFAAEQGLLSRLFGLPLLKWLGKLSYSIYLTHYLIVIVFPAAIKQIFHIDLWTPFELPSGQYVQLFGRNNVEGTFFYLLVLALTLGFSALTYRWIETPGREWSRRWAGRPNTAAAAESSRPGSGQVPSP